MSTEKCLEETMEEYGCDRDEAAERYVDSIRKFDGEFNDKGFVPDWDQFLY